MSKAFKFEVTKDVKLIGKMTISLRERNSSIMGDAHIAAVSCILHAIYQPDGTTTPAAQLCDVFKQDERVNALKRWFETVGPFKYKSGKDGKDFTFVLDKAKIAEFRARDEAELTKELSEGKTFWELVPPKAYKGFDLRALLQSIINRAETVLDDEETAKHEKTKINPSDLVTLKQFLRAA